MKIGITIIIATALIVWVVVSGSQLKQAPQSHETTKPVEAVMDLNKQLEEIPQKEVELSNRMEIIDAGLKDTELKIEQAKQLLAQQTALLDQIEAIEADYNSGQISEGEYLERRARVGAEMLQ